MPQLLAYYWLNQAIFTIAALMAVTYVMSVYVLPPMLELLVARVYVTKL